MATLLPSGWRLDDIRFLVEQVEKYPLVLVNDPRLGIPTVEFTLPVTGAEPVAPQVVRVHTATCIFLFDTRKRTPGGRTWDNAKVEQGTFPYDRQVVLAKLKTFLPEPVPPPASFEAVPARKADPVPARSLPLGWEIKDN